MGELTRDLSLTSLKISADLEHTLADPELGLLFRQFLKEVYAGESLSFWATIEAFHELTEQEEIDKKVAEIFQKYFSSESEYELNIDSKTKSKLVEKIDLNPPYTIDIFDDVQKKVYHLLETDCYSKFLVSKPYKAYQEQAEQGKSPPNSPPTSPPLETSSPKTGKKSLLASLFRKKTKDKADSELQGRSRSASVASPTSSPTNSPPASPSMGRRPTVMGMGEAGVDEGMLMGISMSFGKKDMSGSETIRGLEMYRKRSASRLPAANVFDTSAPLERSSSAVL